MKLNKELKQRIDNYIERISPSALYKLLVEEYGMKENNHNFNNMLGIDTYQIKKYTIADLKSLNFVRDEESKKETYIKVSKALGVEALAEFDDRVVYFTIVRYNHNSPKGPIQIKRELSYGMLNVCCGGTEWINMVIRDLMTKISEKISDELIYGDNDYQ